MDFKRHFIWENPNNTLLGWLFKGSLGPLRRAVVAHPAQFRPAFVAVHVQAVLALEAAPRVVVAHVGVAGKTCLVCFLLTLPAF